MDGHISFKYKLCTRQHTNREITLDFHVHPHSSLLETTTVMAVITDSSLGNLSRIPTEMRLRIFELVFENCGVSN